MKKEFDPTVLKPFFAKRKWLTRVVLLIALILSPVLYTISMWVDNWDDIKRDFKDEIWLPLTHKWKARP